MKVQVDSKRKYETILNKMQKLFIENASEQKMYELFKACISKQFKFEITFDSQLSSVIKEYYKKVSQIFMGTETYMNKLKFIDKINTIFFNAKFISYREYFKMDQIIKREKNSPVNMWMESLDYLKNSSDIEEFRYEFLMKYCQVDEQKAGQIVENDNMTSLKQYYEKFFKKCCEEKNNKIVNFIEDIFSQFQNKDVMLSPGLIKNLQKKLGGAVGSSELQIKLNSLLVDIAQGNDYNNDEEARQRLEDQVKQIQAALKRFSGLNFFKTKGITLRLGKFGSLMSGFAGIDADLDLTILTNNYVNEIEFLKMLHEFLRKQYKVDDRKGGRRVKVQLITQAKTPLVQIQIIERGKKDIKIDLIVNNILGIINSKFLKVYSSVKWIKNLGLLVKLWGKSIDLINRNALSSYAMVIMLIHYLIKSKKVKPILDNRYVNQATPYFQYKRLKLNQIQQFKVYYMFKDQQKDITGYERVNYFKILKGFFKYYGQDIWKEKEENRIITVDQSTDKQVDKQCAITIKDPFDKPHNPGRLKVESKDFLIQRFKDAYETFEQGKEDRINSLFNI